MPAVAGKQLVAPVIDDEHRGQDDQGGQEPAERPAGRGRLELVAETYFLPGVAAVSNSSRLSRRRGAGIAVAFLPGLAVARF